MSVNRSGLLLFLFFGAVLTQIQRGKSLSSPYRETPRSFSGSAGVRCIPRRVMVEETKFEEGENCHHTYKTKCHTTYTTEYSSKSEEKCETEFKRNCFVHVKAVPQQERIRICHTPLKKRCSEDTPEGPEVCRRQFENHCETHYKTFRLEHDEPKCQMKQEIRCRNMTVEIDQLLSDGFTKEQLKNRPPHVIREKCMSLPVQKCKLERKFITKIHPETTCKKIPKEICAPRNCETVPGEEICSEESRAQVTNVPGKECDIQPRQNCRNETILVPRLAPKQKCIRVPKEVCAHIKKNQERIKQPVTKQWCFGQENARSRN